MHCPDILAVELDKIVVGSQKRGTATANDYLGVVHDEDPTIHILYNKGKERMPPDKLTQLVFKLVGCHDSHNI